MAFRSIASFLVLLAMVSCDPHLPSSTDLYVDFEIIDAPTVALADSAKVIMNGVYVVEQGTSVLGDTVVGKWVDRRWCVYSQHEVVFAECAGGFSGDSIKLRGYLRNVRSGSGSRLRLKVLRDEGAAGIFGGVTPGILILQGSTEEGERIVLRRVRSISASPFHIIAHRGGARNSDRLGISENSIEMMIHAATLGASGIEIDIRRTRDNKLIVFHDDTFSPRTVQGTYLLGRVSNFDLEQIKTFGRLLNGESIPTLTEALTAVILQSDLSLVWLDIKDAPTVELAAQIQREARIMAAQEGRYVRILLGMPAQEILDAYNRLPVKDSTEVLIELDAQTAYDMPQCLVWAPVWTREISVADVARMRAAGKLVFSWTVDLREVILDHLDRVDGILSNYPTLVAGIHESRN